MDTSRRDLWFTLKVYGIICTIGIVGFILGAFGSLLAAIIGFCIGVIVGTLVVWEKYF